MAVVKARRQKSVAELEARRRQLNTDTIDAPSLTPVFDPGTSDTLGSNTTSAQDIMQQFEAKAEEAREANLQRYEEILARYETLKSEGLAQMEGLGESQRQELNQRFTSLAGRTQQDVTSRGLTGTTIAPTLQAGVERERATASLGLEEQLTRERLGFETGIETQMLQFMERREDPYPSFSDAIALAKLEEESKPSGFGKVLDDLFGIEGF